MPVEEKNMDASYDKALYNKHMKCPVCNKNFDTRAVRSSFIRTVSKDADFMVHYKDPNPILYDVAICQYCGYGALISKFDAITDADKKLIQNNISSKWTPREFPDVYDISTAIVRYQLALLNVLARKSKKSDEAILCLKIAWLYRIAGNEELELKAARNARDGFAAAFESEQFPISGLSEPNIKYLIGELSRRLGENTDALMWFGRAMSDRSADSKIKDMIRTQKELIDNGHK